MTQVNLNTEELKDFVKYIIKNNQHLQAQGKPCTAVCVEGESGIGKTSTMLQIAKEMNYKLVKLNLAQLEELGDLIGFPCKEFEVEKVDNGKRVTKWIPESVMDKYIDYAYKPTGEKRMTHAAPEWVQGLPEGGILMLDDFSRADSRFTQAVMELIDRQEYASWKLPKNWLIALTSNPDNGDYLVTSLDPAQKTRFIKINLKFDKECWGVWAEKNEIDTRCINFLLMHDELINQTVNARSVTTFFNAISSIKDFEKELPMIQMIGEGSVGPEFSTMFVLFINNRLDKLISPEEIMTNPSEESVMKQLRVSIGNGDTYRADIASLMTTRLINYNLHYAETNPITDKLNQRLIKICTDESVFTNDLKYLIVKKLTNGNKQKFNKLLLNPDLVDMAIN